MKARNKLKDFQKELEKCSACGLCLPACPTWLRDRLETSGPRGRLLLAQALLQRRIEFEQTLSAFSGCLLCGRCDRACPAGIPLTDIFFSLRPMLPLQAAYGQLFRFLAAKPQVQDFLQPPLAILRSLLPKAASRKIPALPAQPFVRRQDEKECNNDGKTALLFAGCITRRFFPDLAECCVQAIESIGLKVNAPADLVCCGRPLAVQGRSYAAAIRRNIEVLSACEFEWLVTPCPGCNATLTRLWPQNPGLTAAERKQAGQLAAKCLDINILLAGKEAGSPAPVVPARGVWWHRPCLLEDAANASALRLPGIAGIMTGAEPDCCGAALNCLKNAGFAGKKKSGHSCFGRPVLTRLAKNGQQTPQAAFASQIHGQANACGAGSIVTACPGCMLALVQVAGGLPVAHSVQIYMRTRSKKIAYGEKAFSLNTSR